MTEFEEKRVIEVTDEEGNVTELFVLSQTRIQGVNYLLVSEEEFSEEEEDNDDDEVIEVQVIKEIPDSADEESVLYEMVEDEKEIEIVTKVFEEMLDDVDFEVED